MYAVFTQDTTFDKYKSKFPTFDVIVKAVSQNDKFLKLVLDIKGDLVKMIE